MLKIRMITKIDVKMRREKTRIILTMSTVKSPGTGEAFSKIQKPQAKGVLQNVFTLKHILYK